MYASASYSINQWQDFCGKYRSILSWYTNWVQLVLENAIGLYLAIVRINAKTQVTKKMNKDRYLNRKLLVFWPN